MDTDEEMDSTEDIRKTRAVGKKGDGMSQEEWGSDQKEDSSSEMDDDKNMEDYSNGDDEGEKDSGDEDVVMAQARATRRQLERMLMGKHSSVHKEADHSKANQKGSTQGRSRSPHHTNSSSPPRKGSSDKAAATTPGLRTSFKEGTTYKQKRLPDSNVRRNTQTRRSLSPFDRTTTASPGAAPPGVAITRPGDGVPGAIPPRAHRRIESRDHDSGAFLPTIPVGKTRTLNGSLLLGTNWNAESLLKKCELSLATKIAQGASVKMKYKELQVLESKSDFILFGVPSSGDKNAATFEFRTYMAEVLDKMHGEPGGEYAAAEFADLPEFVMIRNFVKNTPFDRQGEDERLPLWAKMPFHFEVREEQQSTLATILNYMERKKYLYQYLGSSLGPCRIFLNRRSQWRTAL